MTTSTKMANPDQSSGISTRTLIIGGLAVAAAGAVGYALWFDNQRRRNPAFRKKLSGSNDFHASF